MTEIVSYRSWYAAIVPLVMLLLAAAHGRAAHRDPSTVPPTLEIEVLDPGVDPLGNPAVFLQEGKGGMEVDIPPVVLVHRFYYSGDRSFQAQILPGGPSIVVCNHPKSGERIYIPLQMMPGAPRVTYASHSIEYDYGEHGIAIHFGLFGHPKIKYRNGEPLSRKIDNLIHYQHFKDHATRLHEHTKAATERSKLLACGAGAEISDVGKTVLLPIANLVQMVPLGGPLFGTDWEQRLATRGAEHRRDKENHHLEKDRRWEQYSIPTNR